MRRALVTVAFMRVVHHERVLASHRDASGSSSEKPADITGSTFCALFEPLPNRVDKRSSPVHCVKAQAAACCGSRSDGFPTRCAAGRRR